jgi:sugar phosphate isomerase/epimerase
MLGRLAAEAEKRGIKLGIENRAALEEIPLEDDFGFLMREFNRPGVGYWHDTGHGQIKENLGFHFARDAPGIAGGAADRAAHP